MQMDQLIFILQAKVRQVVFDQIQYMVYPALAIAKYGPFVIIGIGAVLFIVGIVRIVLRPSAQSEDEQGQNRASNEDRNNFLLKEKPNSTT